MCGLGPLFQPHHQSNPLSTSSHKSACLHACMHACSLRYLERSSIILSEIFGCRRLRSAREDTHADTHTHKCKCCACAITRVRPCSPVLSEADHKRTRTEAHAGTHMRCVLLNVGFSQRIFLAALVSASVHVKCSFSFSSKSRTLAPPQEQQPTRPPPPFPLFPPGAHSQGCLCTAPSA
jgi:hypothetical protein